MGTGLLSAYNRNMNGAFTFSDSDLAANQAGKVSPDQRRRVGDIRQRQRWQFAILWGLMMILAVASFLAARHPLELALWWGLEAAYLLWLARRSVPVFRPSRTDADLAAVEGTATLKIAGHERYALLIGNLRFALTLEQYKALHTGGRYRVYYVIPLQIIIAVEALSIPPAPTLAPGIDPPLDSG